MGRVGIWLVGVTTGTLMVLGTSIAGYAQFPIPSPTTQTTQPATPAADARVAQIKAKLEKEGLRVLDVAPQRTTDNEPQWVAVTAARYAQPGWPVVLDQAFLIWGVMYSELAKDAAPQTWFTGQQVWTKYGIVVHARLGDLTALVNDIRAAKTSAEKQILLDAFYRKMVVQIWDFERKQFADGKDFVNKNFAP